MKKILCVCACLLVFSAVSAFGAATNRFVSTNGTHTAPYDSWVKASTNLYCAVAWANTNNQGDIVYVSNGTHYLNETVVVSNTVVQGFTSNYNDVIVSGRGAVLCFHLNCYYTANPGATLSGITITNGLTPLSDVSVAGGGGVFIRRLGDVVGAGGLITNCLITGCRANIGGGVYIYRSKKAHIKNSVLEGNSATNGAAGAVFCLYSFDANNPPLVQDCVFRYNYAKDNGAGIFAYNRFSVVNCQFVSNIALSGGSAIYYTDDGSTPYDPSPVVSNCLMVGNGSGSSYNATLVSAVPIKIYNSLFGSNTCTTVSGGIFFGEKATGEVYNCTIANNKVTGGDAYGGGGVRCTTNTVFVNCIIYSNVFTANRSHDNYRPDSPHIFFTNCCTYPMPSYGENNMTNPPCLVDPPWNFRLSPDSPCVNAGLKQDWMTDSLDLDGVPRIYYGFVDIGAYEAVYEGTIFGFQ